jgi:hypothetical protein
MEDKTNQYFSMSKAELVAERDRLNKNKEKALANLSRLDLLISDIYHVLELEKLSGAKMLKLASKLKLTLNMRREAKESITNIDRLVNIITTIVSMHSNKNYGFKVGKNATFLINSSNDELIEKIKLKELV